MSAQRFVSRPSVSPLMSGLLNTIGQTPGTVAPSRWNDMVGIYQAASQGLLNYTAIIAENNNMIAFCAGRGIANPEAVQLINGASATIDQLVNELITIRGSHPEGEAALVNDNDLKHYCDTGILYSQFHQRLEVSVGPIMLQLTAKIAEMRDQLIAQQTAEEAAAAAVPAEGQVQ